MIYRRALDELVIQRDTLYKDYSEAVIREKTLTSNQNTLELEIKSMWLQLHFSNYELAYRVL